MIISTDGVVGKLIWAGTFLSTILWSLYQTHIRRTYIIEIILQLSPNHPVIIIPTY